MTIASRSLRVCSGEGVRVLVTSAGTASALSVIKALHRQKQRLIWILAVDADPLAVGLQWADGQAVVPKVSDPAYVPHLLDLCARESIEVVLPIFSKEIEILAQNLSSFTRKGVHILLGEPDTIRLANDKVAMAEFVRKLGVPAPEFHSATSWPGITLIGKPNRQSGSGGHCHVENERDWKYWKSVRPDYIFQRLVTGTEYTVDVLCDSQSRCVVCSPRIRLMVKAGQSVKGRTERHPALEDATRRICAAGRFVGPVNLQFFETAEGIQFIELNPRFAAGGLMLTVRAGANIPLLAVQLARGEAVEPVEVTPNVLMIRYWEEVFLHPDRHES